MNMIFRRGCSVNEEGPDTLIMKENADMRTDTTASLRQTWRIIIEMEAAFHGNAPAEMKRSWQEFSSRGLSSARPDVLTYLGPTLHSLLTRFVPQKGVN